MYVQLLVDLNFVVCLAVVVVVMRMVNEFVVWKFSCLVDHHWKQNVNDLWMNVLMKQMTLNSIEMFDVWLYYLVDEQ
jgi:hypothetical protein